MTCVEASVLKQPNEVVEINVAICRPETIRCQIFSYLDIARFDYQQPTRKTDSINFNENPGQAVRSPPQQKQNAISDSPLANGLWRIR